MLRLGQGPSLGLTHIYLLKHIEATKFPKELFNFSEMNNLQKWRKASALCSFFYSPKVSLSKSDCEILMADCRPSRLSLYI